MSVAARPRSQRFRAGCRPKGLQFPAHKAGVPTLPAYDLQKAMQV